MRFAVVDLIQTAPRPANSASKESTGWLPDLRKTDTSVGKIAHGGLDGARGQLAFSAEHSALALASSSSVLQQVGSGPPGAWAAERPAERKRRSGRGSDLRGSFQRFCGKQGFPTHLEALPPLRVGCVRDGLPTAPRAAADRSWTTTYRVWTGTIEIRPTLVSARRPTRHCGLGTASESMSIRVS